jgi:hypothetical protein
MRGLLQFLDRTISNQRGFFGNYNPDGGVPADHDHSASGAGGDLGNVATGTITAAGKIIAEVDTGGTYDSTTVSAILGDSDSSDNIYTIGNTINASYNLGADSGGKLWINFRGHNGGQANFRDFAVADGKGNEILGVVGSTGSVTIKPNTDAAVEIGRVKIGYNGTNADTLCIGHYDHFTNTNYALLQTNVGKTFINSATGQAISFRVNHSEIGNVSATGLIMSPDSDTVHSLGRAKIGYDGSDSDKATFAHYDNMQAVSYAIQQDAAGDTTVNSKTGGQLTFSVGDSPVFNITLAGIIGSGGARIQTFDSDGTMAANDATRVPTQSAVVTYVAANTGEKITQPVDGNYVMGDGAGASIGASNTNTMCFGENAGAAITGSTYNDTILPLVVS